MALNDFKSLRLSRRSALKAGFGGVVAAQLALIEQSAFTPSRPRPPRRRLRRSRESSTTSVPSSRRRSR